MFFEVFPNGQEIICRIIVKEVVYYEELRAQLTNSNITLNKAPGSNYFELSLANAIAFFDQNPIEKEDKELSDLIKKMKETSFNADPSTLMDEFCEEVPFGKTLKAIFNLVKN